MGYTTWILEFPYILGLDWISRHERRKQLPRGTRRAIASRMSPDMLLVGSCTSRRPRKGFVIPLKDKPRKRASPKAGQVIQKQEKQQQYKQRYVCRMLGFGCPCHK